MSISVDPFSQRMSEWQDQKLMTVTGAGGLSMSDACLGVTSWAAWNVGTLLESGPLSFPNIKYRAS